MLIGELADRTGVSARALRHYECGNCWYRCAIPTVPGVTASLLSGSFSRFRPWLAQDSVPR